MYFDTHAHFDDSEEDAIGDILCRAREASVTRIVAIGGNADLNRSALAAAETAPGQVWVSLGLDRDLAEPLAREGFEAAVEDLDKALARQQDPVRVVAVGETGLDYHYEPQTATAQRALFEAQLALARRHALPVVVHSRDADEDTLRMLADHAGQSQHAPGCLGVLHCFTGGIEFAEALLEIGMMISFSGIVTFRNADSLREVARRLPLDRILIETDSPYLAPVPHRGKRNEPCYVEHVAQAIARERNEDVATVANQTFRNGLRLFDAAVRH